MCLFPRWRTLGSAFWLLCWSLPHSAWSVALASADTPDRPPLTLGDAVQRARLHNPDLAVFAFRLKAEDARVESAGLRPAPELGVQVENLLGTGRARGLSGAEATFALSQVLELGSQRQQRQALAGTQRSVVEIDREIAQLDVLAALGQRFVHVAADQEQLALTRRATALVEATLKEVQRRVDVGRSPVAELHRARIAVARAEIEQEHAEHELLSSRRQLAALWGDRTAEFGSVTASLFSLPEVADFAVLLQRLSENPDVLRYVSEQRLHDAEVALAQARGRGSPTVNAGIRRLQDSADTAFVAGISLPLFGQGRMQPVIAEAAARREVSVAAQQAALVDAEARLFALVQESAHAATEVRQLRDRVLPEMDQALSATEAAWRSGRYSYLELTEAQTERVNLQRALIDAAAKAHRYHIEIERLTGMSAVQPAAQDPSGEQP